MSRVVVAGGGLAGLVSARRLADAGHEVHLYERRDELGGRVRSREVDGFTVDRGFQVLFTAYPAVQRELDVGALSPRAFRPGAVIARPGSRSVLSDPLRDWGAASDTLLNPDVRRSDLLRLFTLRREVARMDLETALSHDDVDIRNFLATRGFSRQFVENFAEPFWGGITLDRSLSSARGILEATLKMLVEGRAVVPAGGMRAIPAQLATRARGAGVTIETGAPVEAIHAEAGGSEVTADVGGETVTADAAVVATDPATASDLTGVDTPTSANGCVTGYYALPGHVDLGTGKKLVLDATSDGPNQVAPLSAVAPEYAPDDRTLLSATFLGEREESDAELSELVREAVSSWYPSRSFEGWEHVTTERVEFAQVAQLPGFRERAPRPRDPEGPVALAGDYTQWSSIQGALESGQVAADAVETLLGSR